MLALCFAIVNIFVACTSVESKNNLNPQTMNVPQNTDTATFGAGCFWCVEAVFAELKGVISVIPGYAGGQTVDPTYKEVCSGLSGHAEVAQIVYDPTQISYIQLLEVFFQTHDPTTINRQGNDVGSQYRSVIYFHNSNQQADAVKTKTELNASGAWSNPIVTQVEALDVFYPAEKDHWEYYEKNPEAGYCRYVIQPKMDKFRKVFKDLLK